MVSIFPILSLSILYISQGLVHIKSTDTVNSPKVNPSCFECVNVFGAEVSGGKRFV